MTEFEDELLNLFVGIEDENNLNSENYFFNDFEIGNDGNNNGNNNGNDNNNNIFNEDYSSNNNSEIVTECHGLQQNIETMNETLQEKKDEVLKTKVCFIFFLIYVIFIHLF